MFITSVLGVIGAALASASGEALTEAKNLSEYSDPLAPHALFANATLASSVTLTVLLLLFTLITHKSNLHSLLESPQLLTTVRILTVVVALIALIAVIITGHQGAALVWTK